MPIHLIYNKQDNFHNNISIFDRPEIETKSVLCTHIMEMIHTAYMLTHQTILEMIVPNGRSKYIWKKEEKKQKKKTSSRSLYAVYGSCWYDRMHITDAYTHKSHTRDTCMVVEHRHFDKMTRCDFGFVHVYRYAFQLG